MLSFTRRFIALSLKRKSDPSFGEGVNAWVEVGVIDGFAPGEKVKQVLNEVDHKALGLDVHPELDWSREALLHYLFKRLQEEIAGFYEVRLHFGDGATYLKRAIGR